MVLEHYYRKAGGKRKGKRPVMAKRREGARGEREREKTGWRVRKLREKGNGLESKRG